jgi:ribosomal protein RSM22 (predicted rRNA methylase)
VSHVLNELDEPSRVQLIALARRAAAVVWVEPGTWKDSRSLIAVREELRDGFTCRAPCPHNERCGMLAEENHRHWCPHFATPPSEAFTESGWGRFSKLMGIDPRSLPYSHLVLDREKPGDPPGLHRLIGRPRQSTGLSRLLTCSENGLRELELQKRDAPSLWKTLDKGRHEDLFDLEEKNGRITRGSPHSAR